MFVLSPVLGARQPRKRWGSVTFGRAWGCATGRSTCWRAWQISTVSG